MNQLLTVAAAITLLTSLGFGGQLRFRGTVKRGQSFVRQINHEFAFGLDPTEWKTVRCEGWHVWIGPSRDENFADLATGPLHGSSVLEICAADFRDSDNSGSNAAGPLNVNRPGKVRDFRFVTTRAEDMSLAALAENPAAANEVLAHIRLNKGTVTITRLVLGHLQQGTPPTIERMDFLVEINIPNNAHR